MVQSGVGRWPPPNQVAPRTCPNRPNLVPWQVEIWANLTNFMPFSVNSHPKTGSKGDFCTTHGPIRCGQVATTQPGGTWHLEPAQIGQILFPCKFKIEQIWPFSCHFPAIFPPTKGLFRNLYVTQGLIRSGQVATNQAGGTWHLQSAQMGQILFSCKFKILTQQLGPKVFTT